MEAPKPIATVMNCAHCCAENPAHQKYCSQCGFPNGGTEEEMQSFRITLVSYQKLLNDAKDKIRSARNIIYFLAAAFFLFGVIYWFSVGDVVTLIVNLVLCFLYLIFAAWSAKNPFGAILTAFILYITVIVTSAFVEPATIISGIIFKIIFIGALVKGIRSAREAQHYMRELEKFKALPGGYQQ